MHLSSFLLAVLALAVVAPQDSGQKPASGAGAQREWPWGNPAEAERLRSDVLGTWELLRLDLDGHSYAGRECAGYLLVLPGYLSMHTRVLTPEVNDPSATIPGFSSGTHRWNYDEGRLLLVLDSLLAINDLNQPAELDYEPPGTRREYEIVLAGENLTLSRSSLVRMEFRRLGKATPEPTRKPAPKPGTPTR